MDYEDQMKIPFLKQSIEELTAEAAKVRYKICQDVVLLLISLDLVSWYAFSSIEFRLEC